MKDISENNEFGMSDNISTDNTCSNIGGENPGNDTENMRDGAQSIEKDEKVSENEARADETQEKDYGSEAQNPAEEKENSGAESEIYQGNSGTYDMNSGAHESCSASYEPPFYIPETVYAAGSAEQKKSGEAPKRKTGLIAFIIAACLIVSAVGGGLGAYVVNNGFVLPGGYTSNSGVGSGGTATITKNDGSISVKEVIGSTGYTNLSVSQVVELVADSVVEVTTKSQTSSGAGSGVIVAQGGSYGYIVTNHHVIDGATSITVRLTNGKSYSASLLDSDATMDIAVIRITVDDTLPVVTFGSSSSLSVGEGVVAIGNPLGQLGGTVTSGIVSALDRSITIDGVTMTLLQTDAAVNPGNSGGGLFNMAGELIGIVNAKESSAGIEGLAFAIPVDTVYDSIIDVIKNGYIHGRPSIGIEDVEYISDIFDAYRRYGSQYTGVYVTGTSGGVFKTGDLLVSLNGQDISALNDYYAAVSSLTIGQSTTAKVYRSGKIIELSVSVTEYVPSGIFG